LKKHIARQLNKHLSIIHHMRENNEIKTEQLFDIELGYAFNYKWLNFNTNLYYMRYKNQLVFF
jgi:hypothetical protein